MFKSLNETELLDITKNEHDKKPGVYVIKHQTTNKIYVGSSNNIYLRTKSHISKLRKNINSCRLLQEVYNEDNNLEIKAIVTKTREDAFILEQKILDEIQCNNTPTLNIAKDARIAQKGISSLLGYKMKEEVKQKISLSNTGKPKSEDHKKALTEVRRNKGRECSICGIIYRSCGDAAEALGLDYDTVYNRCSKDLLSYKDWFFTN